MVFNTFLAIIGLIVGLSLGFMVARSCHEKEITSAQSSTAGIVDSAKEEAETLKKEALLEAKEGNQKYHFEVGSEPRESKLGLKSQENRLIQREQTLNRKDDSLEKREGLLKSKEEALSSEQQLIEEREKNVEEMIEDQQRELEKIAGSSKEDAQDVIMKSTEEELNHELALMVKEFEQRAKEETNRKMKNLLSLAVQCCAADQVSETTVSVVTFPNDEMEGRITGREGRSIRTPETLTGINLIIDNTPEAAILSGFDPIRGEITRMTLEKLIQDGRIHPARIEETIEKSRKGINECIREYGEKAAFEVGAHTFHPDLIKITRRLRPGTSYGQSALEYSVEATKSVGILVAELGEDIQLAKRAGLLHDIGKAPDHKIEESHAEIGAKLAAKYEENPVVINAIVSHHSDVETISVTSVLVATVDALSAAGSGARSESLEDHTRRLRSLENASNSFAGVESSYAIQAGCEVRVMAKPEEISNLDTVRLVRNIRKRIEEKSDYPEHIKAIVTRRTRATDCAK